MPGYVQMESEDSPGNHDETGAERQNEGLLKGEFFHGRDRSSNPLASADMAAALAVFKARTMRGIIRQ